jgi:hypothetical protein
VEGETKVSKLPKLAFTDYADEQAENLRQMFVAMTDGTYSYIIRSLGEWSLVVTSDSTQNILYSQFSHVAFFSLLYHTIIVSRLSYHYL